VLPELAAGPLVLYSRVAMYRAVTGLGATPAIQIPGPLRILVVIGSPDEGDQGELLTMRQSSSGSWMRSSRLADNDGVRWDRGSERWFAFVLLACALVCRKRL
jgi:hypothetical protein